MQAVEFTLKKVFPWLASSESDFGLFLLYNAYIPNWSFCKRDPRVRPTHTQDAATAMAWVSCSNTSASPRLHQSLLWHREQLCFKFIKSHGMFLVFLQ